MLAYIIRRLLLMLPTLLGITIVVFIVMAAAPGGISTQSLIGTQNLEPEAKKALEDYYNKLYGLDSPSTVQYLHWLNNISPIGFSLDSENRFRNFSLWKRPNLGTSFRYGRPVLDIIKERVPITLLLNTLSLPLVYIFAITIGVHAAIERGKAFDILSNTIMLGLWSIPTMLAGVLLIGFLASNQYWHWFPTAGLSTRKALDMPFLPHWHSIQDGLLFLTIFTVSVIVSIWIALYHSKLLRSAILIGLGVSIGIWVTTQLPTFSFRVGIFLGALFASILGGLSYLNHIMLRVSIMSIFGVVGGIVLANYWVGDFTRGFLADRIWHLILPILCLTYGSFAFLSRLTRTAVLENLMTDYARTARAKGLSDDTVLWQHVFPNSLLPLITVSSTLLPSLLAGSVIIESIFSIEGMGKLAVEAVQARDRELVLSITLISGLLTLVSYLIADICYAIVDPRVNYD
ncbi:ABC transporter permease [Candidatus Nitrosacidococcus tergens]|uniref:Binding-protein-dependent transport systems inner membrane component n=1 Tax=Candidatus Nitrosacidococcus tergens TaxID=553981 RepID=A0A7G1QBI0_9GAMM|nr:ABC transporter permease [Candidatus Nitrosacidococcus tergens]CAB1277429.1 Binding-protein-dependent transport systems inner membrane component [Candidatus Nitrosacidococcus tergens]